MRRIHAGALVVIMTLAPVAYGQAKSSTDASAEEELKKLDHKWLDSEKNDDVAYCEKFFADSYVLVLASGQMYTKDQWIKVLKSPDRSTFEVLDPEDIQVHLHGNVAILTDHTTIKGHDSKGTRIDGEYRVFRVLIKQNGSWRATGVAMARIR
jgi:ketosteroid isomerase-like protein